MPVPNLWEVMRRPANLPRGSKNFDDPMQPGVDIPVTLDALDTPRRLDAADRWQDLVADYVTGRNGAKPMTLLAPDGKRVRMTEIACRNLAYLIERQVELPEDEQYGLLGWAAVMVCTKTAFFKILAFADELDRQLGADGGNASGRAGETSCSASPEDTDSTPSSPDEPTSSSHPSTSG